MEVTRAANRSLSVSNLKCLKGGQSHVSKRPCWRCKKDRRRHLCINCNHLFCGSCMISTKRQGVLVRACFSCLSAPDPDAAHI